MQWLFLNLALSTMIAAKKSSQVEFDRIWVMSSSTGETKWLVTFNREEIVGEGRLHSTCPVAPAYYWMLLHSTAYYWMLLRTTSHYWMLPDNTAYYWMLLHSSCPVASAATSDVQSSVCNALLYSAFERCSSRQWCKNWNITAQYTGRLCNINAVQQGSSSGAKAVQGSSTNATWSRVQSTHSP